MSKHLLLVDDDALLRRSLAFNLERSGYRVSTAADAEDALAMARRDPPELILLDISLPGMDGLDALREIQNTIKVPVIFLTARRRELDEALGLELGGDDYVTKPFDLDVLLARIKAVLRRTQQGPLPAPEQAVLTVGDMVIDPKAHTVTIAGKLIELTPREFDLLYTLAMEPGRVVSLDSLLSQVWGAEYVGQPQVVYVHIRWLREKIEANPDHPERLVTVRAVGYKLVLKNPE
jgi:DNA-binding response OmpR family regulator